MLINCGPRSAFNQARYIVHLSTGRNLVLFRLPSIDGSVTSKPNENDGWSYYAMESECPHAGGPMAESQVDIEDSAYIVTCPWHAYDFNVETGKSSMRPITACTYPVDVQGDSVQLDYTDDTQGEVTLVGIKPVSERASLKSNNSNSVVKASTVEKPKLAAARYLNDAATLCDWCAHILNTANPEHKIELTIHLFKTFAERESSASPMDLGKGTVLAPHQPPRERLRAVMPSSAPNIGKGGSPKSRIAMLHALANIELWAIDLAIDICIRFSTFRTVRGSKDLPRAYFYDWLKVASDEAKHFSLLRSRLEELGSYFGDLPVHHGLWRAAHETANDLLARISIVCLVHEARGLDVNPMTIEKFRKAGDALSVHAMEIIHNDEITHVTTGHRWLTWICGQEEMDPVEVFRGNVRKHWRGAVRGPFNEDARLQAGMDKRYYTDLTGQTAF
ncbi:hypothetical protein KEM54_005054 [Ascosphaera aggregata]|nr:hypothetical protein KEM54_005054 [Ascosphaera aggregata]